MKLKLMRMRLRMRMRMRMASTCPGMTMVMVATRGRRSGVDLVPRSRPHPSVAVMPGTGSCRGSAKVWSSGTAGRRSGRGRRRGEGREGGTGSSSSSASQASSGEKNVPKRWVDLVRRPENERFDEAYVSLEAGKGGRGEVWKRRGGGDQNRGRMVKNFKYKPGGQQAKNIFLQAEGPANGGKGGSVYVEADERYDSLLHLHKRYHYKAKDGSNANPVTAGRGSVKRAGGNVQKGASPLVLKVPIGTTVISKRGGRRGGGGMSVELLQSGERVLVASGGEGGLGAEEPQSGGRKSKGNLAVGMSVTANKLDWQKVSNGKLGEMAQVHLVLRVKADIGLVGLPNAGKSTLLSAVTRAKPDIADYPFTTLVPNLGVIGGSATTWKEEEPIEEAEGAFEVDYDSFAADKDGFDYEESPLESAVVADLPGLIGDAHKGKGLGRVFLRHLKRTRVICHLVDIASSSDPFSDYIQIREELRMYNPEYVLDKPHVVVFTKCDLLAGEKDYDQERREFLRKTEQFYEESEGSSAMPTGIVFVSSQTGQGMEELVERVAEAFKSIDF